MPRTARRLAALLLASATLASLAACAPGAPSEPTPSPSATETAAPIFMSDEEALAAAVAAYERHLAVTSMILAHDANVREILDVSTTEYGPQRVTELLSFLESGLRATGVTTIDNASLIEWTSGPSDVHISIYACQDVTATRLFNQSGDDVTPTDRDERVPVMLDFRSSGIDLLVSGNQLWSGDDFC